MSAQRLLSVAAAVVVVALLGSWFYVGKFVADVSAPASAHQAEASQHRSSSQERATERAKQDAVRTPLPQPVANRTPAETDVAPKRNPRRPISLAEVEMTPQVLAALENLPLLTRDFVDYRLGLLARLEKCLAGRTLAKGFADMHFLFEVNANDLHEAVGTRVTFNRTDLPPEDQALFLQCAGEAHYGKTVRLSEVIDEPQRHWMPTFRFPLGDDDAGYRLVLTGVW